MPNRATTRQSTCTAIIPNLKRLLATCTTAVAATASGTGKHSANTGLKIVPMPNPETMSDRRPAKPPGRSTGLP